MDKLYTRRVSRLAHFTFLAVLVLVLCEAVMISGALELKAQTVAKYAPWAYEPFLRLVGEHPESSPRGVAAEEPEMLESAIEEPAAETGLLLDISPVTAETNAVPSSIAPAEPAPAAVVAPTNLPAEKVDEAMPVG